MSNQILPFGIGAGANVIPYADYEALPARSGGFVSGVARSEQLNTVWRQSSFVASVLAQFIASRSGQDVLDDGDTTKLLANLELAIKTYANSNLPAASTTVAGIAKLSSETDSSSELLAATPKAIKTISDATLKTANNLSEIKTAGPAAVAQTLANLGLGDAAKRTVGISTGNIPDMSFFSSLLSGAGYQKLPGGLIIQWGTISGTIGQLSWPYPITFPNAVFQAAVTLSDKTAGANAGISIFASNAAFGSRTSLTVQPNGTDGIGTTTARFIVIGW